MQLEKNINGTRIEYEPLYAEDELTETEAQLLAEATQEAENALAAICSFQDNRKGTEGQIEDHLQLTITDLRSQVDTLESMVTLTQKVYSISEMGHLEEDQREQFARDLYEKNRGYFHGVMEWSSDE